MHNNFFDDVRSAACAQFICTRNGNQVILRLNERAVAGGDDPAAAYDRPTTEV